VLVFFVGLVLALAVTAFTGRGIPDFQSDGQLNGIEYFAGFVVAFYVLSATVLAGRIGVANFFMAVTGQTMSSKIIDHFGFLGAPIWPINLSQALGAVMLLAGLIITQVTNGK
jgi:transporter family-2 protein